MGNIRVPSMFTEYDENEIDIHTPTHEELLKKISMNNNYLLNLMPLGFIIYVNVNQIGVTVPDINYWQLCDGSEITNVNSPLRTIGIFTRFTPNLGGKYPRGANSTVANTSGGTHTHNLSHTHNTSTSGGGGEGIDKRNKSSTNNHFAQPHNHGPLTADNPLLGSTATKVINNVRYIANTEGVVGNNIKINFVFDAINGPGIVNVVGSTINVSIVSGVTTSGEVKGYIDSSPQALSLIHTELTGNGLELHTIIGGAFLSGGADAGSSEIIAPRFVYLLAYMKVV